MSYSIGEVAKKIGLTTHTLRYYDKEGLMPYVDRDSAGKRYLKTQHKKNVLEQMTELKKTWK